jgi:hypothetical protein
MAELPLCIKIDLLLKLPFYYGEEGFSLIKQVIKRRKYLLLKIPRWQKVIFRVILEKGTLKIKYLVKHYVHKHRHLYWYVNFLDTHNIKPGSDYFNQQLVMLGDLNLCKRYEKHYDRKDLILAGSLLKVAKTVDVKMLKWIMGGDPTENTNYNILNSIAEIGEPERYNAVSKQFGFNGPMEYSQILINIITNHGEDKAIKFIKSVDHSLSYGIEDILVQCGKLKCWKVVTWLINNYDWYGHITSCNIVQQSLVDFNTDVLDAYIYNYHVPSPTHQYEILKYIATKNLYSLIWYTEVAKSRGLKINKYIEILTLYIHRTGNVYTTNWLIRYADKNGIVFSDNTERKLSTELYKLIQNPNKEIHEWVEVKVTETTIMFKYEHCYVKKCDFELPKECIIKLRNFLNQIDI